MVPPDTDNNNRYCAADQFAKVGGSISASQRTTIKSGGGRSLFTVPKREEKARTEEVGAPTDLNGSSIGKEEKPSKQLHIKQMRNNLK